MPTGAPLWGTTGTGTLPTTEVVPQRSLELGLAYEDVDPSSRRRAQNETLGGTLGDVRFFPIGTATYGLRRGEIGLGVLREKVDDPFLGTSIETTYTTAHGKYRVHESPQRRVAAAVGVHFLDFGRVEGSVTSLYAVGSKVLTRAGARTSATANVGALYNRISGRVNDNNIRPFLSLQGARGPLSLSVDYTPTAGESVQFYSVAARYQKARYGLQLGYGQFRGSDDKLFLGASYRLGGAR